MILSWFLIAKESEEELVALININIGLCSKVSFVFTKSLNIPVFK